MKKANLVLSVVFCVLIFTTVTMAVESMEINEAFSKGLVSLTITGKDKGERVELKAKKRSSNPIILLINKGTTNIAGEVSIMVDTTMKMDLSKKDEVSIILPQTGSQRIKGGSVTLETNPKK